MRRIVGTASAAAPAALLLLLVWPPAAAAAAAAAAPPPSSPAPTTAAATSVKPKPGLRDNELRDAILARFARSKSAEEHFQVHVQGQTATLTGKTDIVQHKAGATRMAKAAGAREVVNRIQVSAAGKAKASAGLRRAGVRRTDTAVRSLPPEKR